MSKPKELWVDIPCVVCGQPTSAKCNANILNPCSITAYCSAHTTPWTLDKPALIQHLRKWTHFYLMHNGQSEKSCVHSVEYQPLLNGNGCDTHGGWTTDDSKAETAIYQLIKAME